MKFEVEACMMLNSVTFCLSFQLCDFEVTFYMIPHGYNNQIW